MATTDYFSVTSPNGVALASPSVAQALAEAVAQRHVGGTPRNPNANVTAADVTDAQVEALAAQARSLVTNEVVELAVDATGGTYTLTFDSVATAALDWDFTAAEVEAALSAHASIGVGNVIVTGGPGDSGATTPYYVQFVNQLGGTNVGAITFTGDLLTGGGSTVTITVIQAGAVAVD